MKFHLQFWYREMVKSPSSTFDIHVQSDCQIVFLGAHFHVEGVQTFVVWWGTPTLPTHGKCALRTSDFSCIRFLVHPTSSVRTTIIEVFSPNHIGTYGLQVGGDRTSPLQEDAMIFELPLH